MNTRYILLATTAAVVCALSCMPVLQQDTSRASDEPSIRIITDRQYFPEVKRLLNGAQKSVCVMMFEAGYYEKYPTSPSNQLIQALIDARKRGLKVDVILERGQPTSRTTKRNIETGKILKDAGVTVYLDPQHITCHTKMILIDDDIIVCGSTNWTYSALTKNHEASIIIRDKDALQKLRHYFDTVKHSGEKL
jgi:cardiolipin synthase